MSKSAQALPVVTREFLPGVCYLVVDGIRFKRARQAAMYIVLKYKVDAATAMHRVMEGF